MASFSAYVLQRLVRVPEGARPGMQMNATTEDGRVVTIPIPPGAWPGSTMQIDLPLADHDDVINTGPHIHDTQAQARLLPEYYILLTETFFDAMIEILKNGSEIPPNPSLLSKPWQEMVNCTPRNGAPPVML